jgi:hypothetical protein
MSLLAGAAARMGVKLVDAYAAVLLLLDDRPLTLEQVQAVALEYKHAGGAARVYFASAAETEAEMGRDEAERERTRRRRKAAAEVLSLVEESGISRWRVC